MSENILFFHGMVLFNENHGSSTSISFSCKKATPQLDGRRELVNFGSSYRTMNHIESSGFYYEAIMLLWLNVSLLGMHA